MIKRHGSMDLDFTQAQQQDIFISNWIWHSHNWVEDAPGYCECIWCGKIYTSQMSVQSTDELCSKNPAIIKLRNQIKELI